MSALVEAVSGFSESGGLASILKLATGGMEAVGAISQRKAEAKEIKAEGAQTLEQAKWKAKKLEREKKRTVSRQRALYAKAGVEIGSGSPLEVMEETRKEYEADIAMTMRTGQQAYSLARKSSKRVRQSGLWSGGTTILSSLAEFSQSPLIKR